MKGTLVAWRRRRSAVAATPRARTADATPELLDVFTTYVRSGERFDQHRARPRREEAGFASSETRQHDHRVQALLIAAGLVLLGGGFAVGFLSPSLSRFWLAPVAIAVGLVLLLAGAFYERVSGVRYRSFGIDMQRRRD